MKCSENKRQEQAEIMQKQEIELVKHVCMKFVNEWITRKLKSLPRTCIILIKKYFLLLITYVFHWRFCDVYNMMWWGKKGEVDVNFKFHHNLLSTLHFTLMKISISQMDRRLICRVRRWRNCGSRNSFHLIIIFVVVFITAT